MGRLSKIGEIISQTLFPVNCLGCGRPREWLCSSCQKNVRLRISDKQPHLKYQDYLDKVFVASYYSEKNLVLAIEKFKYHYQEKLAEPLGQLLIRFAKKNGLTKNFHDCLLIPLPLHRRRRLERGFNQSELLAKELNIYLNLPFKPELLERCRYTKQQTKLNQTKRLTNMQAAFRTPEPWLIEFKKILLLDDVTTTGASLNEAAKTLRQAGATKIFGLVLAKN